MPKTFFRIKNKWLRWSIRTILFLFILLNVMAAFHAWKLTHNYPGCNSHINGPEKMGFIQKAKAILFGVKNSKPIIKTYPLNPYKVVNLYTKDSLKIEGWMIEKDSSKGTVILFHGHLSTKASLIDEAKVFYELGYKTFLIDFRAHGNSDGTTCSIGFKEGEEVKLAYDYVLSKNEKNIILYGVSLGAAAITKSFYDYRDLKPQKIILEMPYGSLKKAVEGRVKMMGLPKEPISTALTFWGGAEQGFWAFNLKPEKYVKNILCPTLLQWGELDKRVTKEETEKIYNNLKTSQKELEVYPRAGHESLLKNDSLHWRNTIEKFLNE